MTEFKLFMILLGCKPEGRNVEQHDVFFGIAKSIKALKAEMVAFWPGSGKLHIDAWREVTVVEGFTINVMQNIAPGQETEPETKKLFFINLGGYQKFKFEEQHYMLLTVKPNRSAAMKEAKQTLFFQNNHFKGAASHIDDKYGIDVDELYEIEDLLTAPQKEKYRIAISTRIDEKEDEIHLGYLKLSVV